MGSLAPFGQFRQAEQAGANTATRTLVELNDAITNA
jgi:hypothetical protein